MRKLFKYIKPYKVSAILSPIFMMVEVAVDILIPFLMTYVVDIGIKNSDINYVLKIGLLMVAIAIVGMVAGTLSAYCGSRAGYGFSAEVARATFRKIQSFSFANLDNLPPATLITRLTNDCNTLGNVMMMSLRLAVRAPLIMIFAFVMTLTINARLARIFIIMIPLMIAVLTLILMKVEPIFVTIQTKVDNLNAVIQENLKGIKVLKSFNRYDYTNERFEVKNRDILDMSMKAITIVVLIMPFVNIMIYACIVIVLWFGAGHVLSGDMKYGELITFVTYITQILFSLVMVAMYFLSLIRGIASAKRINEVLNEESDIVNPENPVMSLEDGSIEFRDVFFRYRKDGDDELKNINLKVESGSFLGIIGSTGSSKSTLVQLLPRIYDTTEGEVIVSGKNVKEYDLKVLRDEIAFVLQKNLLFKGTIRSNMLWGKKDATDQEIIWALKKACAWEFVSKYEDTIDHAVEHEGANFSGGQRQRLCIARALIKRPKIIILDDSTSAVDMTTDAQIRKTFKEELGGITTILIAQRISSVKDCDKIIVMENGEIESVGIHEELLEKSKVYNEIYESQQKGVITE